MKIIDLAIKQLQAVAEANGDEFRYAISIAPMEPLRYEFTASETADGHPFVSGFGFSVEEAAQRVIDNIPAACSSWGYKQP